MDFLFFTLTYWAEDLWQAWHQIAACLAKDHKVLFVSPPVSFREAFGELKGRKLPKSGLQHRGNGLYTLVFPKYLSDVYRFPRLQRVIVSLRNRYVRRIMKKHGFCDVVLFIWHPRLFGLLGKFDEVLSCFYSVDEFTDYPGESGAAKQLLVQQEDALLHDVDVVFANGPALFEVKNRYGNAVDIPMAADFDLYSKGGLPETPVPRDLAGVPHPRIGYIGNLNDKVDFRLLRELSKARPNWSFILVGPMNVRTAESATEVELLKTLPNVFLLGAKPRESLPGYVKGLDVCLISYRTEGAWARYIYPLKLHEYLAAGKPVVACPIRSLRDFTHVLRIASTTEEWLDSIEEAVNEHDSVLVQNRIQVAYENRVEERIRKIQAIFEQKIREKRGHSPASGESQR
jgi:glycosyltransferase involved in cell wall biosynthesis